MLRVETRDGIKLESKSARGLMAKLRRCAWIKGTDLDAYIRKTRVRAERQTGRRFDARTSGELVAQLVAAGLLVDLNESA